MKDKIFEKTDKIRILLDEIENLVQQQEHADSNKKATESTNELNPIFGNIINNWR